MTLRLRTSPGSAYGHLYWRTPNASGDAPEETDEVRKGVNKMGKVSQHLEKVHSHLAAHHSELAACYKTVADVGKASGGKSDMEHGDALRECLRKIAAQHEATSAFHTQMASECKKAIEAGDVQKTSMEPEPLPAGLSRVAPERTPTSRPVPRTGAPQMPMDKANAGHIGAIDFLGLKDLDEL
jgi:hypothetical protein